jgi:L-asparaginase
MITIFTTGGTFDKVYFDANSKFHIGESQVEPILKEGNVTIDYTVESLLRKDSLEITDEDRQLLCERVKSSDYYPWHRQYEQHSESISGARY